MFFWTVGRMFIGFAVASATAVFAAMAYHKGWDIAEKSIMVASVMYVVVIAGRWETVRNLRWAKVTEPVPAKVKVRRGRVLVRRVDIWSSIILGVVVVGCVAVIWDRLLDGTAADLIVACAFMGPLLVAWAIPALAHKVIVTPAHLRIDRAFTRSVVPQYAISRIRGEQLGVLVVEVRDGPSTPILTGAAIIFIRGHWNFKPAQFKAAGRLRAAFDALPIEPADSETVVNSRRPVLLVVAILAAVCFATLAALVLTGVIQDG